MSTGKTLARPVGELVKVKSEAGWKQAKIVDNRGHYKVRLPSGAVIDVPGRDVRAVKTSPSRSRSASRGRGRSSSRSRSPARTKAKAAKSAESTPRKRSRSTSRSRKSEPTRSLFTKLVTSTPAKKSPEKSAFEPTSTKTDSEATARRRSTTPTKVMTSKTQRGRQPDSLAADLPASRKAEVPVTIEREFGGAIGVSLIMLSLPVVVLFLYFSCNKHKCTFFQIPEFPRIIQAYFNWRAFAVYSGWLLFHFILAALPIGPLIKGLPLCSGKRLQYRCNGFIALFASLILLSVLYYKKYPMNFLHENYLQLATISIVHSFVLALKLYVKSRRARNIDLNPHGNSGNLLYDFFMGHELNPRALNVDLKFFFELRPGLIGWVMINLCYCIVEYQKYGLPSSRLLLVTLFQAVYVFDAILFEPSILTTFDITQEGFGWMLAFGDLAWVPFTYTLQARYLAEHRNLTPLPLISISSIILLHTIGFWIFRQSNSQKNTFRNNPYDPSIAHLESMATNTGKRILIGGWWGFVRHPNYLGDIIMAICWSLPCGFRHFPPYFYPVYFVILLVHRAIRDDHACQQKYGAAWKRYCQRVRYRIVPYIF